MGFSMNDVYKIQLSMRQLINLGTDPFRMMKNGGPMLTFNECLHLLTENFMLQYRLFPLNFNPTSEYKYEHDENYLYLSVPKSSVETRELKEGEKGYEN